MKTEYNGSWILNPNSWIKHDENLRSEARRFLTHCATDIVKIDYETDLRLFQTMINEDIDSVYETPSDIIFANTVPLKDLEIEVDERKHIFPNGKFGRLVRYRIIIFDDLVSVLNGSDHKKEIGYLFGSIPDIGEYIVSLYVERGNNYIFPNRVWSVSRSEYFPVSINNFTNTWYAIQISLLHPEIKTLFASPSRIPIHGKKSSAGSKGMRKAKYVKMHRIEIEDIKNITHEKGKGINRKCLVWYVIGHWRKYKSGKTVFIQGYWKGKLRNIKQNLDERERIIDPDETCHKCNAIV